METKGIEVFWTTTAKRSFNQIVKYLEEHWSEKEVGKFIDRAFEMIDTLKRYPEMCRPSIKKKNVRLGILDKHTQLIYHYVPEIQAD